MSHVQAYAGHLDVVDHLLKAEANVEIQSEDQETPLHVAAENGHTDVVRLLQVTPPRKRMRFS